MAILRIDSVTAAQALRGLEMNGNSLVELGQALDEDYKRTWFNLTENKPYLIKTIAHELLDNNKMMRISLIQPGPVPAEERDIKYHFLKGKPYFGGELKKEDFNAWKNRY